ncbi:Thiamine kinase [Dyadobacter sp. CECT 9275]|uniref:Thiamine kinase n=1 Tax=Dyadobacter helix TaxID=2822344 RepID=A0A916JB54_9BACT|nr:phosphotransferase [Dyadobacter sp. CECT 9275]CAG4997937.1 Thiamine kinase [Dyadobacter sp. CECT 9275]
MQTSANHFELLPDTIRRALERTLIAVFTDRDAIQSELLGEGTSRALLYKLSHQGKTYFLRITSRHAEIADTRRHFESLRIASAGDVAPQTIYSDSETGIVICEWVESHPLFESFTDRGLLVRKLADLVAKVHILPSFPGLFNFVEAVGQLILQFRSFGMFDEEVIHPLLKDYHLIQTNYRVAEDDWVSCHNDLHPTNFLCTVQRKLLLIDWECAFTGDRYADLALLGQSFALTEAETEWLLSDYFDGPITPVNRAKFFLMQQVCHLYQGLLMLKFAASCKPLGYADNADFETVRQSEVTGLIVSGELDLDTYEGRLYYGKVCLNEALINFKSDKFSSALESIASR